MVLVEFQYVLYPCPAPRIYGLIRIAHNEQIPVITAEYLRQRILVTADILKLVHHDIHHAFLPFVAFLRIGSEDVERNGYEIIIVKSIHLLLFVQVSQKYFFWYV